MELEETIKSLNSYKHKPLPANSLEWKKLHAERKAQKRKWRENDTLKKLELEKKQKEDLGEKERKEEEKKISGKGRSYTVSIAIPGSILNNAQDAALKTYLVGQIARAAVIFNIDEIVIFDETGRKSEDPSSSFIGFGKKGNCNVQMARILQYLECPQYLRKQVFPIHADLAQASVLNPLCCPHHARADELDLPYREGIVLDKPVKDGRGSYVDVGLEREVQIDKKLAPLTRVTIRMEDYSAGQKKLKGAVVSPSTPRTEDGLYWGYNVRLASSLGAVFAQSEYKDGYDLTIGTSENGQSVDGFEVPVFRHALIVFGGLRGLEFSVSCDEDLLVEDPSLLFNYYLNTCPQQGSKTIRTEEAILITLASLRPRIQLANPKAS